MALEGGPGRGCGRGKTQLWEWESYKPGPEVYEQLWRIRKEPAIVTAKPPEACPIAHAQTRILDRRQTEGAIVRNYYVVRITYSTNGSERHDTEDVDLSRILRYVSPAELERFENEQFRLEAEAEAIAVRAEIEELARRRLKVNARGRGGRINSSKGLPPETKPRARGRPKGTRSRGRGGSRGLTVRGNNMIEQVEDDSGMVVAEEDEELPRVIPETEDEEEIFESPSLPSPGLMRSAFVANSALSASPVHRRFSTSTIHQHVVDEEGSPLPIAQQDQNSNEDDRRIKRQKLGSTGSAEHMFLTSAPQIPTEAFAQAVLFSDRSSAIDPDSSPCVDPGLIDGNPPSQAKSTASLSPTEEPISPIPVHNTPSTTLKEPYGPKQPQHNGDPNNGNNDAEEEYVVEAILEHYHDGEKTYYLVKWEGYADSHDWLPEEELGGARDLVREYNERVGSSMGQKKKKKGAFFS